MASQEGRPFRIALQEFPQINPTGKNKNEHDIEKASAFCPSQDTCHTVTKALLGLQTQVISFAQ